MSCSATSGGILDRAIEAEDREHGDIMRLVGSNLNYCAILFVSLGTHVAQSSEC